MSVALFHSVSKKNLFQNDGQQGHQASDGKRKREWMAGRVLAHERRAP
jgi:4'-phosphopantetheinyl transferase EntD